MLVIRLEYVLARLAEACSWSFCDEACAADEFTRRSIEASYTSDCRSASASAAMTQANVMPMIRSWRRARNATNDWSSLGAPGASGTRGRGGVRVHRPSIGRGLRTAPVGPGGACAPSVCGASGRQRADGAQHAVLDARQARLPQGDVRSQHGAIGGRRGEPGRGARPPAAPAHGRRAVGQPELVGLAAAEQLDPPYAVRCRVLQGGEQRRRARRVGGEVGVVPDAEAERRRADHEVVLEADRGAVHAHDGEPRHAGWAQCAHDAAMQGAARLVRERRAVVVDGPALAVHHQRVVERRHVAPHLDRDVADLRQAAQPAAVGLAHVARQAPLGLLAPRRVQLDDGAGDALDRVQPVLRPDQRARRVQAAETGEVVAAVGAHGRDDRAGDLRTGERGHAQVRRRRLVVADHAHDPQALVAADVQRHDGHEGAGDLGRQEQRRLARQRHGRPPRVDVLGQHERARSRRRRHDLVPLAGPRAEGVRAEQEDGRAARFPAALGLRARHRDAT